MRELYFVGVLSSQGRSMFVSNFDFTRYVFRRGASVITGIKGTVDGSSLVNWLLVGGIICSGEYQRVKCQVILDMVGAARSAYL